MNTTISTIWIIGAFFYLGILESETPSLFKSKKGFKLLLKALLNWPWYLGQVVHTYMTKPVIMLKPFGEKPDEYFDH